MPEHVFPFARRVAKNAGIIEKPLINLGGDTWVLFPWLGSYAFYGIRAVSEASMR